MQSPTSETSYVIPVMTPQACGVLLSNAVDAKEQKMMQNSDPRKPATAHVTKSTGNNGNYWSVPFFSCFAAARSSCCMSTCCPCVVMARIHARMDDNYPNALIRYGAAIIGLVVCILLSISHSVTTDTHKSPHDRRYGEVRPSTDRQILFFCGALFFFGLHTSFLCLVRVRVRRQYGIHGHRVEDVLAAACCAPCTMSQMASQAQSFAPDTRTREQYIVDTLPRYPAIQIP